MSCSRHSKMGWVAVYLLLIISSSEWRPWIEVCFRERSTSAGWRDAHLAGSWGLQVKVTVRVLTRDP